MAIDIFVKNTGDNQEYRIQVLPSDTFLQIKEKIKDITNINVDDQVLKFNGLEVTDDYTIEFYEIEDGMMIELEPINQPHRSNVMISAPTHYVPPYGDQYMEISALEGYTTVAELKVMVHRMLGAPVDRIKLFYRDRELSDDLKVTTEFVNEDEPIEMKLSDMTQNEDSEEEEGSN